MQKDIQLKSIIKANMRLLPDAFLDLLRHYANARSITMRFCDVDDIEKLLADHPGRSMHLKVTSIEPLVGRKKFDVELTVSGSKVIKFVVLCDDRFNDAVRLVQELPPPSDDGLLDRLLKRLCGSSEDRLSRLLGILMPGKLHDHRGVSLSAPVAASAFSDATPVSGEECASSRNPHSHGRCGIPVPRCA